MAKPVLQTRNVGLRPHYSGHPLAPMEIVYECEEPVRDGFLSRLWHLPLNRKVGLLYIVGAAFMVLNGLVHFIAR